jgi:hypothetical protein
LFCTMSETTPDELLDWLCWSLAMKADRFYPPDKTARECMNSVNGQYDTDMEINMALEWERGSHYRAVTSAEWYLNKIDDHGFNPVERAAREHRELMEKSDDIDPIDWSWWSRSELV